LPSSPHCAPITATLLIRAISPFRLQTLWVYRKGRGEGMAYPGMGREKHK